MADGQIPPDPFVQSPVQPSAVANDHAPSVPSPLNPDAAARPLIRTPKPIVREQREKKDSLKKRENAGTAPGRIETPDFKASAKTKTSSSANAPLRYQLSFPESGAWIPPRDAIFDEQGVMYAPDGQTELRKVSEQYVSWCLILIPR
jgi:COMPASS component BRE2